MATLIPRTCPTKGCGGKVVVVQSLVIGDMRIRYYGCRTCGRRPRDNKRIVPLIYAPARKAA